ncbi:MAG: AmmeMemoRadiSam system radical SAM enzyme [bacterium]
MKNKSKEALFYKKLDNKKAQCILCPKHCVIPSDKAGFCRARENVEGILYAVNYGQTASSPSLDPIEKKPLYHFYPGSLILSLGANSCNFACKNCQNWSISQVEINTIPISPRELSDLAKRTNSLGVAYTYTEPFTWYEFVLETAGLIRDMGMKNVLVTNGFVEEEPLKKILPLIDALNIDIKSMNDDFYKKVCAGRLEPVLKTVELSAKTSHVEITNLVIPGLNDLESDFHKLVDWLSAVAGPDVPLHFSRYFPNYKMETGSTPVTVLETARKIAREKLHYVYVGNVPDISANTTYCPKCNNELIQRVGYSIKKTGLKEGKCVKCETKTAGIGL